jgi:hypothetical protein
MATPRLDRRFERRLAGLVNARERAVLTGGLKGVEREALRVRPDGHIARTPHPRALGSALTHPHVTTYYSEALIELVTPPFQQAGIRHEFQRFGNLPPEQRHRLRAKFEQMPPSERRAFLLGARARELAEVARRAFAFVPPEERARTLEMLRDLPVEDRQRLRELTRRLSPAQREELRRALLQHDRDGRSGLLRERLGER